MTDNITLEWFDSNDESKGFVCLHNFSNRIGVRAEVIQNRIDMLGAYMHNDGSYVIEA